MAKEGAGQVVSQPGDGVAGHLVEDGDVADPQPHHVLAEGVPVHYAGHVHQDQALEVEAVGPGVEQRDRSAHGVADQVEAVLDL